MSTILLFLMKWLNDQTILSLPIGWTLVLIICSKIQTSIPSQTNTETQPGLLLERPHQNQISKSVEPYSRRQVVT